MKKSKRKKSKKRITNNYLGMAVISVVVLLLLGGLAMKSHSLRNRIAYYDAQAAELKQQISDEKSGQRKLTSAQSICRQMSMRQRLPETDWGL